MTVSKAGFEGLRELTVTGSEIFFSVKNQNGDNRGRKGLLFGASEKVILILTLRGTCEKKRGATREKERLSEGSNTEIEGDTEG